MKEETLKALKGSIRKWEDIVAGTGVSENKMHRLINTLNTMKNRTINNYVLAGLSSSLIGGSGFGKVRIFEKQGEQLDSITPHSHRFDFTCLVLGGSVTNRVWEPTDDYSATEFQQSELRYSGVIGVHDVKPVSQERYRYTDTTYGAGKIYSMQAADIHSIYFSRDAYVLFLESPEVSDTSVILEPVIADEVIPTYKVEPWMFKPATTFIKEN